jgi:chaperonin GroEL (HSP60 family)
MTFIEGCKNPKAVTILIRGGTERIVDEAERAIHDALSVVRDVVVDPRVVAGGGAPEAEVAKKMRDYAEGQVGKEQLAVRSFAEALEIVPITLAENAGLDPIDINTELRTRHDKGEIWTGVDALSGKAKDMKSMGIFEPLSVKQQIIKSASEATAMILKIDDVIASSKTKEGPGGPKGPEEGAEEGEY